MREAPLFDQFQSGDALFYKALRFLILFSGVFLLAFTGILELTWPQQIVLGIFTVALVIWADRSSGSYLVTLTLMLASMFSTPIALAKSAASPSAIAVAQDRLPNAEYFRASG